MNRFEDEIARQLRPTLGGSTRSIRALARWAAASVPPGALASDAVKLALERVAGSDPDALTAELMAERPDRFGRNWESGPAH